MSRPAATFARYETNRTRQTHYYLVYLNVLMGGLPHNPSALHLSQSIIKRAGTSTIAHIDSGDASSGCVRAYTIGLSICPTRAQDGGFRP